MTEHEQPQERPPWGRPGERPGAPRAEDQLADQGVRRRPPAARTANAVATWVDKQIEQASRQGAFDNLAGAGKPLQDVDVRTDPDWWVRGLIQRENLDLSEALPGVMRLRREKAGFPDSLLDLADEAAVRARLEDFNERVLADRRRPHIGPHPPPVVGRVDVEELVEVWRARRPARPAREPGPEEVEEVERADRAGSRPHAAPSRRWRWWRR